MLTRRLRADGLGKYEKNRTDMFCVLEDACGRDRERGEARRIECGSCSRRLEPGHDSSFARQGAYAYLGSEKSGEGR